MPSALIWGASGGIGRALVTKLKDAGWTVYAVARDEDKIPDAADETYEFLADNPTSINAAAMNVANAGGTVDLVVYAAGGIIANPLDKLNNDDWQSVIAANLSGAFYAIQSSLGVLDREGAVMVIGAKVEKITLPRFGAYTTAKAGLEPMMTIFQKENRKLKFTLVKPPAVDTPFWDNVPFKLPDGALKPEDVADAILKRYEDGGKGDLDL